MLCQYRDIFGKPGEGFHKTRLFGVAAYDLIGTIILIIVISFMSGYSLLSVGISVSLLTIFLHKIFCVETTLTKKIFSE